MFGRNKRAVTTPLGQTAPEEEGKPHTVISAVPLQTIAVAYYDENGKRVEDVWIQAGDQMFKPANSIEWLSSFKSVRPWARDGVLKCLAVKGDLVEDKDLVDIIEEPAEPAAE